MPASHTVCEEITAEEVARRLEANQLRSDHKVLVLLAESSAVIGVTRIKRERLEVTGGTVHWIPAK